MATGCLLRTGTQDRVVRWGAAIASVCLSAVTLAAATTAGHELRLAAIAPAGSPWARLLKEFSTEIDQGTQGRVTSKWYYGGVAGDEAAAVDRAVRGNLDGLAGAVVCEQVAPSLRALEVAGYVESAEEAQQALDRLRPAVESEFRDTPLVPVALSIGFGNRVLFSRQPVRSFAELQRLRVGVYELDRVELAQLRAMGLHVVPLKLENVAAAFDGDRIDAFVSIPLAAIAFRYSVKARYYTDLQSGFLPGCILLSRRVLDELSPDDRRVVLEAGRESARRFDEMGPKQDEELLTTLLPRQGLKPAPMSPEFRREFFSRARQASHELPARVVSRSALETVQGVAGRRSTRR